MKPKVEREDPYWKVSYSCEGRPRTTYFKSSLEYAQAFADRREAAEAEYDRRQNP